MKEDKKLEINLLNPIKKVGTVKIPELNDVFVAKERFVVGKDYNSMTRISFISKKFRSDFIDGEGKIEHFSNEHVLGFGDLLTDTTSSFLFDFLEQKTDLTVNLSDIYTLISMPISEAKKILMMDRASNLFFVKNIKGELRLVCVFWDFVGFGLISRSAINQDTISKHRIFFPDFI